MPNCFGGWFENSCNLAIKMEIDGTL